MRKMVFWKRYFWFMAAVYIIFLLHAILKPTTGEWIDIVLNTFTLITLFGYSFNKKLLFKEYWQGVFFVCAAIEVLNLVKSLPEISRHITTIIFSGIWCTLIAPIYIATFLYAFRNDKFWESVDERVI